MSQSEFPKAQLVVIDGDGDAELLGRVFPIVRERTMIGRKASLEPGDVCIPHHTVSNRHAGVLRRAGGFLIVDVGSTGGLYVNQARVSKGDLNDGDVILIGRIELRFEAFDSED